MKIKKKIENIKTNYLIKNNGAIMLNCCFKDKSKKNLKRISKTTILLNKNIKIFARKNKNFLAIKPCSKKELLRRDCNYSSIYIVKNIYFFLYKLTKKDFKTD